MQSIAKTEYMMIIDGPQHSHQPLSNFTFSSNRYSPNPQNFSNYPPQTNFGHPEQVYHNMVDATKYKINREKDGYRSNQYIQRHGLSQSLVFSAKGLKNASDGQESEKNYQSLTLKLEQALNKISFSQQNLKPSRVHEIWKRSQLQVMRKKKLLQRKRDQYQLQRLNQFRQKPVINKNSQRIAKEAGYEPIYTRFKHIVDQKKKRTKQAEQQKQKQKEQQESSFLWELSKHMKKPQTTRTYDQYFSQMIRWKEKAEEKTKLKFEQEKKKEISAATFKPRIDRKSQKMVASQYRLPIYQRGLVKKKTSSTFNYAPTTTRKPCK